MRHDPDDLVRYTAAERLNHWMVAITFILLALSGLAFFHPMFYPLVNLFGGGTWTRILHPFIGLVMTLSFASMYFRFRKLNIVTPADREWLRHVRELATGNERNMPKTGKYNGGQKVLFWLLMASMAVLVVSGFVIWRAYFSALFPIGLIRLSSVAHAAAAALMIILIMGHIYLAIWTRGSIRAMTRGTVSRAWAKQHHALWYHEMTRGEK